MKGKGILYEDDDAPIKLMDQDDTLIASEFSLSLIGKVLNPKKQNVEKLLRKMPSQSGMEDRITANDLGNGKFLLNFTSEEDLNSVLRQGPFHFNFCMFVLVRWEPIVHDDYPWIVPFMVQVIGIPLHLWTDINLKNIGHVHVDTLEVAEGRMLVDVDSRKPLKFSRKVESKDGDEVTIEIKYEKLFKQCSTCGMLTHEKDHCPSVDMRSRLQPQSDRPGIFTRMQAPQEIAQHHTFHREQGLKLHERQPYAPRLESSARQAAPSRYYEDERKYAQRRHHPADLHATHSDRIMRRRNDPTRGDRYGGSRASKGPYDRNKRQTWREKAETNMRLVTTSQPSAATATSSRQIVPCEQSSSMSNNDINGMVEQTARVGESNSARGAKRLASTIVTPSRINLSDHNDMEENVTKRAKELTRSLSFTDLSDHEPVTAAGDNQIIGALNDMEIEDNQDDGMMECEGMDEDLLGIDLKDMEEREALQVVSKATSGHVTSGTDTKVLKSSRQGTKVNVPLGLQNKKFEILRRGSPRKPSSSSQGAHTARDSTRSRKHSQSSKKQRGSVSKGDGLMGTKNSSQDYR
ncbi:hypothetical protein BRARA_K00011 [Brassica rapa]|uniref:DUF4283 domain-containing protein n=1 Tax=Brassica campestris TaxID=3711 RepID=A0A397L2P3_BRACM|nr:hypothetical protein BRARA_K00011 [Brassica rapa]